MNRPFARSIAVRRPSRANGERAFTLVELTVALLAGLIVAMGIVSLSREATNTFHEEARGSAAEAALRTAMDRLRADLQRASYMSTGNILADPSLAHAPGATNIVTINSKMKGILGLGSIYLEPGGSITRNANIKALSSKQSPGLTPDFIRISGNMSVADQFDVAMIKQTNEADGCRRIYLTATAPALYRLLMSSDGGSATELNNVFMPSTTAAQFIVRLVDNTGHSQFLATCSDGPAGLDAANGNQPYVDIDYTNTPVITASQTGTMAGPNGYCSGKCWINPVQIVQWEIIDAASEPAQDSWLARQSLSATDANKFDLIRSYVDATGTVVPGTQEVVAEYAADLAFAFSVDKGTAALPAISTFAFDDATNNGPYAKSVASVAANQGPQRIRVVRARLATRASQADRTVLVSPPATSYTAQNFLYRYCMVPAGCGTYDGTLKWARARTLTAEVTLPNQSRNFY
jgi:type II secretory pathway pseudopilin PulG